MQMSHCNLESHFCLSVLLLSCKCACGLSLFVFLSVCLSVCVCLCLPVCFLIPTPCALSAWSALPQQSSLPSPYQRIIFTDLQSLLDHLSVRTIVSEEVQPFTLSPSACLPVPVCIVPPDSQQACFCQPSTLRSSSLYCSDSRSTDSGPDLD